LMPYLQRTRENGGEDEGNAAAEVKQNELRAIGAIIVEGDRCHESGAGQSVVEGDRALARHLRRPSVTRHTPRDACMERKKRYKVRANSTLSQAHCIGTMTQLACSASDCSLLSTRAGLPLQSPAEMGSARCVSAKTNPEKAVLAHSRAMAGCARSSCRRVKALHSSLPVRAPLSAGK
jgi:hypothetical protein